jgi:hypothetical protein
MEGTGSEGGAGAVSHRAMWLTLVAMTLSNSMILVDQTAVPLATPDAIRDLGGRGPVFTRRSRWVRANVGRTPGLTRHPPPTVADEA